MGASPLQDGHPLQQKVLHPHSALPSSYSTRYFSHYLLLSLLGSYRPVYYPIERLFAVLGQVPSVAAKDIYSIYS